MAPKISSRPPQEVNTATISTFRPGTPVVPLSQSEHEVLSETAREQGVNTAEAMKRLVDKLPQAPPRHTVSDQSLDKIQRVRDLNLSTDDPGDPLNQMMRYGFYKDIKKEMKSGGDDRMSTREMMEMAILQRMLPPSDNGTQGGTVQLQQIISDMKAENEKNRLYFETTLKEQNEKIKEMVFEKRIQTMEETHTENVNGLSQQLADVNQRMELYRNIPTNPSLEEKKDAVSHLEELGGQIERIKKALAPFGITSSSPLSPSSSLPPVPGQDIYRRPDGTMDYFRYSVDKLESTIGKVSEAWQKKTPDRKTVAETPSPAETHQTEATYRQLSPEEYADNLLAKTNPTQEEEQWLSNYTAYLEKQRVKLQPQTKVQQFTPQTVPERQAVNESQIEQRRPAESVYEPPAGPIYEPPVEQPKRSIIDRLREQEEEDLRRSGGIL